jgi:hypothetical protein
MKTLVKLAAIAACFIGLHASKASAEFPRGDRNDIWIVDTGGGYSEVEWTYLMLLDLGLTEYEAMVLLADDIFTENIAGTAGPGGSTFLTENIGGSADPGGDDIFTENIGSTSGPGGSTYLTENIAGSADPGGDDIFTENIGGTAGPGGSTFLTENLAGSSDPGGDDV